MGLSVQLSILIPTHRQGLQVCSRIIQACSWAGPDIEVIVRDNSGSAEKRELLARFRAKNCNIIAAEPCGPLYNYAETLRLAKGEFVLQLADDDFCFDRAIQAMPELLAQARDDHSIIGVTGAFAIEGSQGSAVIAYPDVDSPDLSKRIAGYFGYNGVNVLMYAPLRRALAQRVFEFMSSMPTYFSFHDQIQCLLYLMSGKFLRISRLIYGYDVGPWENPASAEQRDLEFYRGCGLDPAINKLHWFICGFEGAALALNSDFFPDIPRTQRQWVADRWFSAMFARFAGQRRQVFDSALAGEAEALYAKLVTSTSQLSFDGVLVQISAFMALCSKERGERYFAFWNKVLKQTKPAAMQKASA
jgi:hypothetical protein